MNINLYSDSYDIKVSNVDVLACTPTFFTDRESVCTGDLFSFCEFSLSLEGELDVLDTFGRKYILTN